jgi:glycerol-3-phosphate dehydrogenase
MTEMGYDASMETADSILREVDFGRKGAIEFADYLDVSLSPNYPISSNPFTSSTSIGRVSDDSSRLRRD